MAKSGSKGSVGDLYPHLALQAHGWDPYSHSAGSDSAREWICELGHIWSARISDRTQGSGRCPVCIGKRVLKGFNDLATVNPTMAKQAHGWDPTSVTSSSNKVLGWKCSKGHEWQAKPSDRTSNRSNNCPICTGRKLLSGFNDLATTHPELAKEAFGWDPRTIQAGSRKSLIWKCKNKHEWSARVSSRALQGSACRECSKEEKTYVKPKFSVKDSLPSVLAVNSALAAEAHGWDPAEYSAGSNKKMSWKCTKGHVWDAVVDSRIKGRGCPVCSGKKIQIGENDLASLYPDISEEADGWNPESFSAKSNKSVGWKCKLGHRWEARISSRTSGKGCPICAGNVVLAGFNDLNTTHPEIAFQMVDSDPSKFTAGSDKKVKWKCPELHTYVSSIKDRTHGHGCPSCAKTGFDQTAEGWFYLLIHPNWGLMQLGITNVPKKRLAKHKKNGWEVIDLQGPMNGLATRELETQSLRYLNKIDAQTGVEYVAGKFDGYSESWFENKLQIRSIKELRKLVQNDQ